MANDAFIIDTEEHECNEDANMDSDICSSCREHAGFCSECYVSNCCGSPPYGMG